MDGSGIALVKTLMTVDLDQDLRISKGRVPAIGGEESALREEVYRFKAWAKE